MNTHTNPMFINLLALLLKLLLKLFFCFPKSSPSRHPEIRDTATIGRGNISRLQKDKCWNTIVFMENQRLNSINVNNLLDYYGNTSLRDSE